MKRFKFTSTLLLAIYFTFSGVITQAQDPGELIWHTFQGGLIAEEAYSIDRDNDGNLYIVGRGETDWDMAGQSAILQNPHNPPNQFGNREFDVFAAKFTSEGVLVWYTFLGNGDSNDDGWDIAVDGAGNAFIVGRTLNWYQWGVNWSEESRAFVAKLSANGILEWMHTLGTREGNDVANGVDVDEYGNVYVTGTNGKAWTDIEGVSVNVPKNNFIDAYGGNSFVAKFDNSGGYLWHTFFGPGVATPKDIVVKGSNVYIAGHALGRMTIPSINPVIEHAEGEADFSYHDAFALKMNTSGDIVWYTFLGFNFDEAWVPSGVGAWAHALDVDDAGMLYLTGSSWRDFNKSTPINPRYSSDGINFNGGNDCFVAKLNSNDNTPKCFKWSTFLGYSLSDSGEDIKLDGFGNVLVGLNGLSPTNVLFMLDNNGKRHWKKELSIWPGTGVLHGIVPDENGGLFFTGHSGLSWAEALGGYLIHPHHTGGQQDAFVAKIHTGVDFSGPPVLYVDKEIVTVSIGSGYVENLGRVFHSDLANVTLSVSLGNMNKNLDGTWEWDFNPSTLLVGFYPVTVTATAGNGAASEITFNLQIVEDAAGGKIAQALWWLVRQQRNDGSWGGLPLYPDVVQLNEPVTSSGWALTVLCQHAFHHGFLPFDEDYPYVEYIKSGFDYLFAQTKNLDEPGEHIGLFVYEHTEPASSEILGTAAALLAISASGTPNVVIDYPANPYVDGLTYQQFANEMVNYLSNFQNSVETDPYYGSWGEGFHTGHVMASIGFADAFGCNIPQTLRDGIDQYIYNQILLMTDWSLQQKMTNAANLLTELAFLGYEITPENRAGQALDFIESTWPIPRPDEGFDGQWNDKNMELLYAMMRGLESHDTADVIIDGSPINWYDFISNEIIHHPALNEEEGFWGWSWGGDRLHNTCWALLTLFKEMPDFGNNQPSVDADNSTLTLPDSDPIVNSGTYSDPDEDYLYLTSTIGKVVNNGDNTWSWSLNTTINSGVYDVIVSAYDGKGGFDEAIFQLTLTSQNKPPVITCPPSQILETNLNCSYFGSIGTAIATDDSLLDPVITNNAPTYLPLGITHVTWTATDNLGFTDECIQVVTVEDNQSPVMTCPEDIEVSVDVGVIDTTVIIQQPIVFDNCDVTITGSRNDPLLSLMDPYLVGETTIIWNAKDISGNISNQCTQTVTISVVSIPPPEISCPVDLYVSADENCEFIGLIGDPVAYDENYELSISNDAPQVFPLGDTIVTWTAKQNTDGGKSSSCTQSVIVLDVTPPVPDLQTLPDVIGECEATVDIVPTASDNCSGTIDGTTDDPLHYTKPGTYLVTWTYDDGNGNVTQQDQNVNVINIPPEISLLSAPVKPVPLDTTVFIKFELADDNIISNEIDWGDGNSESLEALNGVFNLHHTYDSTGVYTVIINATDGCEETDSYIHEYIVIYDPLEGFVTGGGWIESPLGAYIDNPHLTGEANFGFVSKYKKGKTTPEGNTEFKFHAADLNFHSSLYDWLIIAGSKAMFKGKGTINGEGWYGFQLSAIDADLTPSTDVDKFRIKIWNKLNNDFMVYDNLLGQDLDENSPTAIAGGSIKIHKSKLKKATIENNIVGAFNVTNYPNPFSDFTTIKFSTPEDTDVLLKVYNVFGQEIRTLVNQQFISGTYTIQFDANGLSPGSYFYSIKTSTYTATKKMVLFK